MTKKEAIEELKLIQAGYPYPDTRLYKVLSDAIVLVGKYYEELQVTNTIPEYYIIQLLEDYDDPANTKKYKKNQRLMVWNNALSYVVVNSYHDSISKDYCKIVHDIDFKSR